MSSHCTWDVRLSDEELVSFFGKYDIVELNSFIPIFKYIYTFDIDDVINAYQSVYSKKSEGTDHDKLLVFSNISIISNKNNVLTDRELEFLAALSRSVSLCLADIEKSDVRKERYQVDRLADSIDYEMEQRRLKSKPKLGIYDIKVYKKEA